MRKYLTMLLLAIGIAITGFAQSKNINGKVTDENGKPVPNASVLVKGTKIGTSTNADGTYNLSVPPNAKMLIVTSLNFAPREVTIGSNHELHISLLSKVSSLDEVVVQGYQTIKRRDLTTATSTVAGKELEDRTIGSFTQLLQGQAPGVQVTGSSGRPGANSYIRIRGTGSINASSEPLIIVDGLPISTTAYNMVNPDEIDNISILKDAAATSIYGSRGSNGVIVITTKSGKGTPTISYSFLYSKDNALELKNVTLMDAMQKFQYEYAGGYYSGNGILDSMITNRINNGTFAPGSELNTLTDGQRMDLWTTAASRGVGDWRKYMLQQGLTRQHQVGISGAKDKFKYYLSLNISNNDGVVYGSFWNKIGGRLNVDYSVNDWFKIGTNIGVTTSREKSVRELFNGQAAYTSSMLLNPYEPLKNVDGTYNYTSLGQNAMETTDNNPNILTRLSNFGTIFGEIKPLRNLTFKSQLGINYNTLSQEYYLQPGSYLALTLGYNQKRDNGNSDFLYVFTNTANWQQSIKNKHNLNFLAGTEFTKDKFYSYSMTSRGFPSASVNTLDNGSTPTQATTSKSDWAMISYFANFGYNFSQKYYVTVSGRRDGSSRFGQNARFANFGAVSAAWDIHNDVLKYNNVISLLKARASYGIDGNNSGIGNYQALGTYALNVNYNNQPASSPNSIANPNLTWEKSEKTDFAIDYGILENRITGSIDFYNRQTRSLLYNVNLSTTTGFSSYIGNIGGLQNRGIELSLSVDVVKKKDWSWNVSATYTSNRNKVTQLYKDSVVAANTGSLAWFIVGQPIFTYKMVKYDKVDPATGKNMYYNIDGTTTANYVSSQAQVLKGKSNQVKYYGSFSTTIQYKGLDLSAQFYYSGGNYIMNYVYQVGVSDGENINYNQFTAALDYWKKPGDNSKFANLNDPSQNVTFDIDRYLEKGDYISLRNLIIGYQLHESLLKKLHLKGIRVYLEGTNLFLSTKFHGLPEVGEANGESASVVGGTYSLFGYPQFRSLAFGVNVKL